MVLLYNCGSPVVVIHTTPYKEKDTDKILNVYFSVEKVSDIDLWLGSQFKYNCLRTV